MKTFLLLLVLLPATLFAKDYHYDRVCIYHPGYDNISIDKVNVKQTTGKIAFNGRTLTIDNKTYKLKSWRKRNLFRSKGMIFKFVYKGDNLDNIQVLKYDQVYCYYINNNIRDEQQVATN